MKMLNMRLSTPVLIALVGLVSVFVAHSAQAQICPGSHLTYIVRDARGKVINAASKDLKFNPDNGTQSRKWGITRDEVMTGYEKQVPDSLKQLNGKISALTTEGMCIFKQPVKLQLTFKGKTMNLIFLVPKLSEYDSRNFLVDSLPFREGTFEIELTVSGSDTRSRFYPASGWRKVK